VQEAANLMIWLKFRFVLLYLTDMTTTGRIHTTPR